MIILPNNFTNIVFFIHVFSLPFKGTYFKLVGFSFCIELMYFGFYVKKFEAKSLREMKLRYTSS